MAEKKIPIGFVGMQRLVTMHDSLEAAILDAADDFERVVNRTPNVAFVRMNKAGIQEELRKLQIPGLEIVPVEAQLLMHHVWVGER